MTIRKLKEMIADLPDDMRVYADDAKYFGDDVTEFCHVFISKREPRKAILQTVHDIDAFEETTEMLKWFSDNNWEEQDAWIEISERGYKPEDFADSDWAREQMENYGLI